MVLQKGAKIAMKVINYAKLIKYAYSPTNFSISEIDFKFRFQRYMTRLYTGKNEKNSLIMHISH